MAGNAREIAFLTLRACEKQGAWSDLSLKNQLRSAGLGSRDAALATRLCFGVLQYRMLLDYYIGSFSSVKLEQLELGILEALRLGVYQIIFLDRIPPSAAVNESVKLAKKFSKNPRSPGLVNGILRAVARSADSLPEVKAANTAEILSIRYSHPLWLVEQFLDLLGPEETEQLLAANNGEPPTTAQVNTIRADRQTVLRSLFDEGANPLPHPWLPECLTLTGGGDLERFSAFQHGDIYIQDTAARLAVMAANPKSGMRVLDACAAPGGKSFAAAIAMEDKGEVFSCDIHPHKESLIQSGAERLGLRCIHAGTQDAKQRRPEWEETFDLVIADVPCSGLGIIRKKPDIRYKMPEPLENLPIVQSSILENVSAYVKPGGTLLYCTCTLLERENAMVTEGFLQNHPEYLPETFQLPGPGGLLEGQQLTLWPHLHGTDGFYIAKMRKQK